MDFQLCYSIRDALKLIEYVFLLAFRQLLSSSVSAIQQTTVGQMKANNDSNNTNNNTCKTTTTTTITITIIILESSPFEVSGTN